MVVRGGRSFLRSFVSFTRASPANSHRTSRLPPANFLSSSVYEAQLLKEYSGSLGTDNIFFARSFQRGSPAATGMDVAMKDPAELMDNKANAGGGVGDLYGEDSATMDMTVTPWLKSVASGMELLREPRFNKGLAFTAQERERHYLRGLLPPAIATQELQAERLMERIRRISDPLEKYITMMDTEDRNERLFYRMLIDHVEELMPIVYTPTVGEACQKYGAIFHRPHGLYISIEDRGSILEVIKNWPERHVGVIVVTDGERILGLGDLGAQGMGIPVGKLALYTALGGIRPSLCLPITLDVGTNNQELLDNKFYIGLKKRRSTGAEYDSFIDEFMGAVKAWYGEKVLVQFEDFANHNAFRLLEKYATTHLTFNDDIQGTAAVALAGIIAALPIVGGQLKDHTFLFLGAGEAGTGIAEIIALAITKEETSISLEQAREKIWLCDSKGLVTKARYESLQHNKRPFAKEHEAKTDLLSAIKALKPVAIIGTTAQPRVFTKECVEEMTKINKRPIIFALSNPTSRCECTAEEAYTWSNGKALFASGSPFGPVEVNGQTYYSGQSNNAYIFPGMGLGAMVSQAVRIHEDMFLDAAAALASHVTQENLDHGLLYPPFKNIRKISASLGVAVAKRAYELGLATHLPRPKDLLAYTESCMYAPYYRKYR
eukprot:TRINITY_DN36_c0_g1_i2.p1 TRINITY_DN36_c0_g1~~TRINITY_DN36_c0_g1_i2.p1  ORF type:complete len:661 (+),score=139.93 TRINITY_DN36_c0_g1_i2:118-2100(+)